MDEQVPDVPPMYIQVDMLTSEVDKLTTQVDQLQKQVEDLKQDRDAWKQASYMALANQQKLLEAPRQQRFPWPWRRKS